MVRIPHICKMEEERVMSFLPKRWEKKIKKVWNKWRHTELELTTDYHDLPPLMTYQMERNTWLPWDGHCAMSAYRILR